MRQVKVLYITSENTTTSIPLEVAGMMKADSRIRLRVAAFYGQVKGEPASPFHDDIINLNVSKSNPIDGFIKTRKLIREIQPDVLHVHHNFSALVGVLVAWFNGVKIVIKTEHNDHRFLKWHQKILNLPILALSSLVICNSNSTKKSFYWWEKVIAGKKATVIYNGININKISSISGNRTKEELRTKYGISDKEVIFFCAARFVRQKNLPRLLAAFCAAAKQNRNITLLIAGGGGLQKELMLLKDELDPSNKIHFLGVLPREEVYQLMNACNVFLMVSLWEGFCNALVEAMVARCNILCSNIETLKEVVGEGKGYFADPSSVHEIAEMILKIADPTNAAELAGQAENAFRKATSLYNLDLTSKKYVDEYLKFFD